MYNLIELEKETKELEVETEKMFNETAAYKIVNAEQYVASADILKQIKGKMAKLEERRKEITTPLDEAKRSIMALFKKPMSFLENAENKIKEALIAYRRAEEEKARIEQERIRKEAEKEAKRQEELAKKEKDKGKKAELLAQAEMTRTITPTVSANIPKVDALSPSEYWDYEVVDIKKVERQFLVVNDPMLSKLARDTKGSLKISGIKFIKREGIRSGKK